MTTTTSLNVLSDADFAARMATYRPNGLEPEVWDEWADEVADIVRAAEPSSAQDLTYLLGVVCGYLRWSTPVHGTNDFAAQVTEDLITQYLKRLERAGTAVGTLENRRSQLLRVHRGLAGLPTRKAIMRGRSPYTAPYSPSGVHALRAICAPSEELQVLLRILDDRTLTTSEVMDRLKGVATDRLREDFARAGLKWSRERWRVTWAAGLVNDEADFVTLALRHGFSRNDCERFLAHHPATPGTPLQLRG
ncbi:hypothetical protein GCM10022199_04490 [Marihabitans asiaticum]|uniref:Uncharacterized protein n=1 Tax=Marihabitans asiaticum TaxID=415218 RepID=A0A560WDY4_9MICO|nr:hypothetical protein [Marihabitans asiaticum]TWD15879.1 hypothetical protein FB557_1415 [Marihabitans asiaticum]